MSREEMLEELKYARAMFEFDATTGEVRFRNDEDRRQAEALDMAIEILTQEPCEDYIKREDALMALTEEWTEFDDEILSILIRKIKALPSVSPMPCVADKDINVPTTDCISREAVINAFKGFERLHSEDNLRVGLIETIKALPSVSSMPKMGKWLYDRTRDWDGECKYECSECGMGSDVNYPYCMRCGVKMQEVEE